jgi:hypothetical protein
MDWVPGNPPDTSTGTAHAVSGLAALMSVLEARGMVQTTKASRKVV